MIEVHNLTKIYRNGVQAVDNISLQVNEGEIHGLLGPNGAGKSTIVKILTTLLEPTNGSIKINGYDLKEKRKIRQILSCVFQDTIVEERLTGYENFNYYGSLCNVKKSDLKFRIKQLCEVMELEDSVLRKWAMTYSGGMKRKLDIAVALISKPKILFLDEPTLGLDPNIRRNLWEHIKSINHDLKVTVLLTTHYLDEADMLCNNVSIIDKGVIVKHGSPVSLKGEIDGDIIEVIFSKEIMESLGDSKDALLHQILALESIKDVQFTSEAIVIYCHNYENNILDISKILSSNNLQPTSLKTSRPSLDDVFMKYTGSHFRSERGTN